MHKKANFDIPFGEGTIPFTFPEGLMAQAFEPLQTPALDNVAESVRACIEEPLGSRPLAEILSPGNQVVIVTADVTRKTNYAMWLPHLFDECNRLGVKDADIALLIGGGIHPPHDDLKNRQCFGAEVCARVQIWNHDATAAAMLTDLGVTTSGTPVRLNSRAVNADRVIVTGGANYHCFAGFSGGSKGVIPGISSKETIQANHRNALKKDGRGREMRADHGRLVDNPVHEDMVEVARMFSPDFLINIVNNAHGEVARILGGDLVTAHEEACKTVEKLYCQVIPRKADLIIASSGGFPYDISFYQAVKTLESAGRALRDGGTLIMVSECRDGYGSLEWEEFLQYQDTDVIEDLLRENFTVGGFIYYDMRTTLKRINAILVSSLTAEMTNKMGLHPASDLSMALNMARDFTSPIEVTYVFPQGSMSVPFIGSPDNEQAVA